MMTPAWTHDHAHLCYQQPSKCKRQGLNLHLRVSSPLRLHCRYARDARLSEPSGRLSGLSPIILGLLGLHFWTPRCTLLAAQCDDLRHPSASTPTRFAQLVFQLDGNMPATSRHRQESNLRPSG